MYRFFLQTTLCLCLLRGTLFLAAQSPALHQDCCCNEPILTGVQGDCPGGNPLIEMPDTIPVPQGQQIPVQGIAFPQGGQYDWYDANTQSLVHSGQICNLPGGDWDLIYTSAPGCQDTFPIHTQEVSNAIEGRLFVDLNGDGVDNDPAPVGSPLQNIEVWLIDTTEQVVAMGLTDANGNYLFEDVLPNPYRLFLPQLPSGNHCSPIGGDSFYGVISRKTDPFVVPLFGPLIQIDGGLVPASPVEIRGIVWDDQNGNGIQDIFELPISNFEVKLELPGQDLDVILTDENGVYRFPYLPQGPNYDLGFLLPPGGGTFSPANQGGDDNVDSDVNPFGQLLIPTNPPPAPVLVFDAGVQKSVKVKVVSILGGAVRNDGEMGTELQDNGLLPVAEPYSGLGYGLDNPGINLLPGNIPDAVDWITVELRDKNDSTQIVASKAAIIKKDGCIVDANTGEALCFENTAKGSYFVAVRHRNHLDIMTADPVFLDDQEFTVDFTDPNLPTSAIDGQKELDSGLSGLWGGDANGDNELKFSGANRDPQNILMIIGGTDPTQQTTPGYYLEDTNLDGISKFSGPNRDPQIILENIGGNDPTQTRKSGLPN
ncbi:MAG: SdrD B-like domain-containing protein [Bacteroidota bacterium]